jgi:hypothetical protein
MSTSWDNHRRWEEDRKNQRKIKKYQNKIKKYQKKIKKTKITKISFKEYVSNKKISENYLKN